jgi:hypothetical protein
MFCEETDDLARALLWNQLDIGIVSVPREEQSLLTMMGSAAGSSAGIENSQNLSTGLVGIWLRIRTKHDS